MYKRMFYTLVFGILMVVGIADADLKTTSQVQEDIRLELDRYFVLESPVDVAVDRFFNVTLKGTVDSYWTKRKVLDRAARVNGVHKIKDRIEVKTRVFPDEIVEKEIRNDLDRTEGIKEPGQIQVRVQDGVVTLTGTVNYPREDNVAIDIASWSRGVKDVVNKIQVLPPTKVLSDKNLAEIANSVIDRFFPLEKDKVQVRVENGRAILKGDVNSIWAKKAIEEEVDSILGIIDVDNNLQVVSRS